MAFSSVSVVLNALRPKSKYKELIRKVIFLESRRSTWHIYQLTFILCIMIEANPNIKKSIPVH
ncbi:hypothetical protein HMPREF9372_3785 [Sporosarcina newyorkensis 2681]|uniref:Uncharacterized protein n=1 Tax=Sporosarcina newyorkensis 2681 TaxID=1027292 RepID=F9DYA4_9BACL|nr:hypothetical protein HMPREF9372_3785 [Sporosarcina newyorkensis 2681]